MAAPLALAGLPGDHAALRVPLVRGLVIVSATHAPDGDRENVVTVDEATGAGVRYSWHLTEPAPSGGQRRLDFERFVSAEDLKAAGALHTVFSTLDRGARPGHTSYSFSSALYDRLLAEGSAPIAVVHFDKRLDSSVTLRGTVSLTTPDPIAFPVLLNGVRVNLSTLQAQAAVHNDDQSIVEEFWILADRAHPLILRNDRGGGYVLQTVRIELPPDGKTPTQTPAMEKALSVDCRVELPGIYFAFGRADLDDESARTLGEAGRVLARHPDWEVQVEGHTDNIGTDAANQTLSQARAAAVRASLIAPQGVNAQRLTATGYGATRPRESNATLEGRARNRRVELVRPCGH